MIQLHLKFHKRMMIKSRQIKIHDYAYLRPRQQSNHVTSWQYHQVLSIAEACLREF